jgi:hypothetical protein
MRIRIVYKPPVASIDGIQLDRFEPGYQYDVGNSLAALMLAEGWAQPVALEEPGLVVPVSETAAAAPDASKPGPANLLREYYSPCIQARTDVAPDLGLDRRRRQRRSS